MKIIHIISTLAIFATLTPAQARFSESRLTSAKANAAKSGKFIAFVFYQEYYNPNCPKCVVDVNARNSATKRALPSSDVVTIEVDKKDKEISKLPSVVGSSGGTPRIVVTDAECTKVIATYEGTTDRAKGKEFEKTVRAARTAK